MKDRETIGLTAKNKETLDELIERGWFDEGQEAAKFCFAFALKSGESPGNMEETSTTWNAGAFDKTGELRSLIAALFPNNETPVRAMEFLINRGLELVRKKLSPGSHASDFFA